MKKDIDLQGHRGCRGLYPENTIPAFEHAIDLDIPTLELDVVISKDKEVIVSHEPFFNHSITTLPNDEQISEENEKDFNMYTLTYEEIKGIDVGRKVFDRFPDQTKMATYKPSLAEMVKKVEEKVKVEGKSLPNYNIEIKRTPEGDNVFHPDYKEFADLVIQEIEDLGIMDRTTVQCFDVETLQYCHVAYPHVKLVYLIQNNNPIEENIKILGFTPHVYSPYFKLVSNRVVTYCDNNTMLLIPWTVNEKEDMMDLMKMGVHGIISDYPDRLIDVYATFKTL